jgi:hypothetical protein
MRDRWGRGEKALYSHANYLGVRQTCLWPGYHRGLPSSPPCSPSSAHNSVYNCRSSFSCDKADWNGDSGEARGPSPHCTFGPLDVKLKSGISSSLGLYLISIITRSVPIARNYFFFNSVKLADCLNRSILSVCGWNSVYNSIFTNKQLRMLKFFFFRFLQ